MVRGSAQGHDSEVWFEGMVRAYLPKVHKSFLDLKVPHLQAKISRTE